MQVSTASMSKRFWKASLLVVGVLVGWIAVAELRHRVMFGHFAPLTL